MSAQELLSMVREQLQARGAKTIRGLGRVFRNIDSVDGNRKIDRGEFLSGLKELGLQPSQDQADVSFTFQCQFITYSFQIGPFECFGHQR